MLVEVFAIIASVAVGAVAYYAVTQTNRLRFADKDKQLADKDRQLAEKDERIRIKAERNEKLETVIRDMLTHKDEMSKRLEERIAALERELKDRDDKAEVMLGQIADLTGDLNFERGIYARPEADALQRQKIERIEAEPNPLDDPPKHKPGRDKK